MQKLIFLPFLILFSFFGSMNNDDTDYDKLWKEVDKHIQENLPQSALATVEKILIKSEKDKNYLQSTKAGIYKSKMLLGATEDGFTKMIDFLKAHIKATPAPYKSILQQAFATSLNNYLNWNYHEINQRTSLGDIQIEDPMLWSSNTFHHEISELYLASLAEKEVLDIPVGQLKLLLHEYDKEAESYVPSLYDVLARKAISHFSNPNAYVTEVQNPFKIDSPEFFGTAKTFASLDLKPKDKSSKLFYASKFFQEHLKWNIDKNRKEALAEANLSRIAFVYNNSQSDEKDKHYLERLNQLADDYKDIPQYSEVLHLKALLIYNENQHRTHTKMLNADTDPFKEVIELCKRANNAFPKSKGAQNARNLHNTVYQKSLEGHVERILIPGESNLIQLNSRNIKDVTVKVVALNEKEWLELGQNNRQEPYEFLFKQTALIKYDKNLNNEQSYYRQNAEIEIPPLTYGYYGLLITEKGKDKDVKAGHMAAKIAVTKIGYFLNTGAEGNELVVFDRMNGNPLKDVSVEIYQSYYSRNERKHIKDLFATKVSDANGKVQLGVPENNQANYTFKFELGQDQIHLDQAEYLFRHRRIQNEQESYLIFTDRSIYRPGQIIHFKVLALLKDADRIPNIQADRSFTIEFKDANNQLVEKQELITNSYGSASGQFIAPKDGLKGRMNLIVSRNKGYKNISVEEYKRPKFYTEIETIKGEYKLGDTLKATVTASNFAGNALQGAAVTYRVKREARFPYWPYWRYNPYHDMSRSGGKEIINGSGVLDNNGKYEITFIAEPDKKVNAKYNPVFTYTIYADVTDVNGETHSHSQFISVSEKAFEIEIDFPKRVNVADLPAIKLKSVNLNGVSVNSVGSIKIYRLQNPDQVFRKRYWQMPDTILIEKEDFRKRFSAYGYNNRTGIEHFPIEQEIVSQAYNFDKDQNSDDYLALDLPKALTGGAYKIFVSSQDSNGNDITKEHFFEVQDFEQGNFAKTSSLHYQLDKKKYVPGEEALLQLGTSNRSIDLMYLIERNNSKEELKWMKLNGTSNINIPISEKDKGGVRIHLHYVLNNRFYNESIDINVPWDDKKLDISFVSFRNKLIPGAKEEIKLKITSPGSDLEKAEFLAAMYDASLDAILPHNWSSNLRHLYPTLRTNYHPRVNGFSSTYLRRRHQLNNDHSLQGKYDPLNYPDLDFNILGNRYYGGVVQRRGKRMNSGEYSMDAAVMSKAQGAPGGFDEVAEAEMATMNADGAMPTAAGLSSADNNGNDSTETRDSKRESNSDSPVRKNLQETVFFFPDLETDQQGNLTMSFTMGEALTKWKLMSFAHDKSFRYAHKVEELVTQKDLMVFPNMPRYLRDKDQMLLQTKVVNLTDKAITGNLKIELTDAISGENVNARFQLSQVNTRFELGPKASENFTWEIQVPERSLDAVLVRVIAESGKHTDGEENFLPVLTDKILVTETRSLIVKPNEKKKFEFEAFANNRSNSMVPHKYSLEYTPNPAWYAIQSLPYLMEYPHKCTEQIMNRFYANALASYVANSHPKIKQVFDSWSATDSDALLSNLEKNEDLKSALLKETPWLLDGKNESLNKKRIANLFDLNKMASDKKSAINILKQRQLANGGFAWFEGGRANRYITQYLVENLGHLFKLNVLNNEDKQSLNKLLTNALRYLDSEIEKEYRDLKKSKASLEKDHLSYMALHYLYTRSFFIDRPMNGSTEEIHAYYLDAAGKYGKDKGIYGGALAAISLLRNGNNEAAKKIEKSLMERSLQNDEMGIYWNEGTGYRWFELPIERHALMIEYLTEASAETHIIDELKKWLLLNKQTNNWKTTKGTSAAIYALLVSEDGKISDQLSTDTKSDITLGSKKIDMTQDKEAATGYIRRDWYGTSINKDMAKLVIDNKSDHLGWGGVYWQYFEDMDKVKGFKETPLTIEKEIYLIEHNEQGEVLSPIIQDKIAVGDKVSVRIIINSDRSMEYLHLKDMRASGFEPVSTLSKYKWKNGLYYYESPGDLATDFFIDYLPKGKYVFEYRLVANQVGTFSNGISTLQCMYAPEYSSHSQGSKVEILGSK